MPRQRRTIRAPPHITQPTANLLPTSLLRLRPIQEKEETAAAGSMKLRSLRTRCAPSPVGMPPPALAGWGGRTLVVGVRRDAAGRELLAWALAMVAAAGDRVIALHITSADVSETEERNSAAADSLASVLGAYDAFCDLKQINLELRVCHGSSIKKALVSEASSYCAGKLIVGVTKNSTAVAKYCAKRVPKSCSVLAVSGGAVVYHGNAMPVPEETISHSSTMSPRKNYSAVVETPRKIYRKILDAAAMIGEKAQDDSAIIGHDRRSLRRNMSLSMTTSTPVSPKVASASAPAKRHRLELPEVAAGWPLLRKDIMPAPPECSEISVVQWVMRFPSRCSPLSPISSSKSSGHPAAAPSRNDSTKPSPAIEEAAGKPFPELVSLREKYSSFYTLFSYSDLAKITSNFSPERVVGKGGGSRVYGGCSEDGKELAVKVLKPSEEAMREFISEIDIVSSVDHKNAMPLAGFCIDHGELMLVYDYMRRGNLEEMLHGEEEGVGSRLGWPERFKVAVGVARALDHLHGGGGNERPVIHRDVKSSNILVSEDGEPKLCDFGLALWAADAASQVAGDDDVAGTFGYLAPEYFMHGKVSDKMDVYAFGVVLLELVSGRKPVSFGGSKGHESLVMWASSVVQGGKLMELVDPRLRLSTDAGEVERMILAAALCIRRSPQNRPSIANVLTLLHGDGDAVKLARWQIGVSGGDDVAVASPPEKNEIQSYINLALLDDEHDDSASVGSADFIAANMSLEEYMKGRWSRSSSFD